MQMRILAGLVCLMAGGGLLSTAQAQHGSAPEFGSPEGAKYDRATFLELARILRLPAEAQKREIPHVYRDIWPRYLNNVGAAGTPSWILILEEQVTTRSPEALVAEIERKAAPLDMPNADRDLCLKLLPHHIAEIYPQILESLHSEEKTQRTMALTLIERSSWQIRSEGMETQPAKGEKKRTDREILQQSPIQVYAEPLLELHAADPEDDAILRALAALDNPHALEVLVGKLEKGQDLNSIAGALQTLCTHRDPPEGVLRALRSPEVKIRRAATTALQQSGSGLLVPYIARLAQDTDPEVRIAVAVMGECLTSEADWEKARPALLPLLSDPVGNVRGQVADFLVYKEGKKMAHAVLRLIQDEGIPKTAFWYVREAMHGITGDYFGYADPYSGPEDNWRPTTPGNRAAIRKFAAWVQANAPEKE